MREGWEEEGRLEEEEEHLLLEDKQKSTKSKIIFWCLTYIPICAP